MSVAFFAATDGGDPPWQSREITCLGCGRGFTRSRGYVGNYCSDCRDIAEDDDA